MEAYLVFGIAATSIDEVSAELSDILSVRFEPHTSRYAGRYNKHESKSGELIEVKYNFHPDLKEWEEAAFQNYEVLLYVSSTARPSYYKNVLRHFSAPLELISERQV